MLGLGRRSSSQPRDFVLRRALVAVFSTDTKDGRCLVRGGWQSPDTRVLRPDGSARGFGSDGSIIQLSIPPQSAILPSHCNRVFKEQQLLSSQVLNALDRLYTHKDNAFLSKPSH